MIMRIIITFMDRFKDFEKYTFSMVNILNPLSFNCFKDFIIFVELLTGMVLSSYLHIKSAHCNANTILF